MPNARKTQHGGCSLALTKLLSFAEKAASSRPCPQLCCGLLLRGKRIALASSHAQPATASRSDLHFDFSKNAGTLHILWRITKRVLLAKIASNFCRHACGGFACAREVGDSSGILAEPPEEIWVFFLKRPNQGDRVDQSLRLASLGQHLRILEMAGIVSTIADDDERLLLQMPVLQVMQTLTYSIVERGSPPRRDGRESFPEFLRIVRKCFSLHKFN